jgi:hypothetical protein
MLARYVAVIMNHFLKETNIDTYVLEGTATVDEVFRLVNRRQSQEARAITIHIDASEQPESPIQAVISRD